MKDFLKQFSTALCSCMIAISLIMFPYPKVNVVYADDDQSEEECDSSFNDDGSAGVWKPGCEWNDALDKNNVPNQYREGLAGIIEQYFGAIFAVVAIRLFSRRTIRANMESSNHQGGRITFPIVQVSALAYLAGEFAAIKKYKDAGKIAIEAGFENGITAGNFSGKQDETVEDDEQKETNKDANELQIKAFNTLEKIYQEQAKGLEWKVGLVTAAEVGLIAAEVVEIADMIQASKTAETTYTTQVAEVKRAETTLGTSYLTLTGACPQVTSLGSAYLGLRQGYYASQLTNYGSDFGLKTTNFTTNLTGVTTSFGTGGIGAVSGVAPIADTEAGTYTSLITKNDGIKAGFLTSKATSLGSLSAAYGTCPASIGLFCNVASAGCAPPLSLALTTAITQTTSVEAVEQVPVLGGGDLTVVTPSNFLNADKGPVSKLGITMDHFNPTERVVKSYNEQINEDDLLFYFERFLGNVYHRIVFHKIENTKYKTPKDKLVAMTKGFRFADKLTKLAIEKAEHFDYDKYFKELRNKNEINKNGIAFFEDVLKKINVDVVESAYASDDWNELLNFGVATISLYFLLKGVLSNHAFPKPKMRAVTWALLAAINATVLVFNKKTLDDVKERERVVAQERQRFANSHVIKTEVDTDDSTTDDLGGAPVDPDPYINPEPITTCAHPKQGGLAPASCPQTPNKATVKIPRSPEVSNFTGGVPNLTLDTLEGIANNIAQTGGQGDTRGLRGNLNKLDKNRNALTKLRDKLRKISDDKDKRDAKTVEQIIGKKLPKFAGMVKMGQKFKDTYTGIPVKLDGKALAAIPTGLKEKAEKVKAKSAVNNVPNFNIPKKDSANFDFDLGEDGKGGTELGSGEDENAKEEDLAQFNLDGSDIIDKPGVSIFKVISNRYLRSYPVLLEEKEQKQ